MHLTRNAKLTACAELAQQRGIRLAAAMVGSGADASDVVQQALAVASAKPEQIPAVGTWPWLARVIAFEARNLRRSKARTRHAMAIAAQSVVPSGSEDPLETAVRSEMREKLSLAISELAEELRDALALVYAGGLSVRAAAAAAGVPRTTLQRRLDEGLEHLRRRLGVSKRSAVGLAIGFFGWKDQGAVFVATGGSTGAAALLGATAMTTKQTIAACVMVLMALGLAGWLLWPTDDTPSPERPEVSAGNPLPQPKARPEGERVSASQPGPVEAVGADAATETAKIEDVPAGMVWREFAVTIYGTVTFRRLPVANASARMVPADPDVRDPNPLSEEIGVSRALPLQTTGRSWPEMVKIAESEQVANEKGWLTLVFRGEELVPHDFEGMPLPAARLVITAPGHIDWVSEVLEHRHLELHAETGEQRVDNLYVAFQEQTTVTGTAYWMHDRSPIPGARIRLEAPTASSTIMGRTASLRSERLRQPEVVTGVDGRYVFHGYHYHITWQLFGAPPGFGIDEYRQLDFFRESVPVGIGSLKDGVVVTDLVFAQLSNLRFRLMPDPSQPIEAVLLPTLAWLRTEDRHSRPKYSATSEGVYNIPSLHSGHSRMVLRAPGFEPVDVTLATQPGQDLDLGVIHLERGTSLRGRVTDKDGDPVAGARITVAYPIAHDHRRQLDVPTPATGVSGSDGRFLVYGVGEGLRYVWVDADGFAVQCSKIEFSMGEAASRDFVVSSGGVIEGVIRTPQPIGLFVRQNHKGEPWHQEYAQFVPDVVAERARKDGRDHHFADRNIDRAWRAGILAVPGLRNVYTFRIERAPPETGLVRLNIGSGVPREAVMLKRGVRVVEGETTRIEFDFRPAETPKETVASGTVIGRVSGRDGKPLQGAWVSTYDMASQKLIAVRTTEDGSYRLRDVPIGELRVSLTADRGGQTSHRYLAPSKFIQVAEGREAVLNFDLSVEAGVEIQLTVTLDGSPFFQSVWTTVQDGPLSTGTTATFDGSKAILYLPTHGKYNLYISGSHAGSSLEALVQVEASAGQLIQISRDFKLAWISGRVEPPADADSGFRLAETRVVAIPSESARMWSDTSSASRCSSDGRFRIPVIAGKVWVRAIADGYGPAFASIEAEGEAHIDLQLGGRLARVEVLATTASGIASPRSPTWYSFRLQPADDLGYPGRIHRLLSSDRAAPGALAFNGGVSPGEYVVILDGSHLELLRLTGLGLREEQIPGEGDGEPRTRYLLTVPAGGNVRLEAELRWK